MKQKKGVCKLYKQQHSHPLTSSIRFFISIFAPSSSSILFCRKACISARVKAFIFTCGRRVRWNTFGWKWRTVTVLIWATSLVHATFRGLHAAHISTHLKKHLTRKEYIHIVVNSCINLITCCSLSTLALRVRQNLSHTDGSRPSGMFSGVSSSSMAFIIWQSPSATARPDSGPECSLKGLVLFSAWVLILWTLEPQALQLVTHWLHTASSQGLPHKDHPRFN